MGVGELPQTPVLGRSREAAGESREIQGATVQGFRGLRLWKGTLRPPWQWEELVTWNEMGEAGLKGSGTEAKGAEEPAMECFGNAAPLWLWSAWPSGKNTVVSLGLYSSAAMY